MCELGINSGALLFFTPIQNGGLTETDAVEGKGVEERWLGGILLFFWRESLSKRGETWENNLERGVRKVEDDFLGSCFLLGKLGKLNKCFLWRAKT